MAAAAVVVAAALLLIPRRWMTLNDITTGATPAYPELQSREYAADPTDVLKAARAACQSLPRWRVVSSDAATLRAECTTLLFHFVDDVTVTAERLSDAPVRTRAVIRSHSRVGRGDLGENARHIIALQAAMDTKLGRF